MNKELKEKARDDFAKYYVYLKSSGGDSSIMIKGISDFLDHLIDSTIKSRDEELIKEIKNYDRKEHICRFNDGDNNCDCFNQGIDKAIGLIKSK